MYYWNFPFNTFLPWLTVDIWNPKKWYMAKEWLSYKKAIDFFCIDVILKTCYAAAAAKSFQSCPTLCDPIDCSPPRDSPGKNTGVDYHFLLQCMKVKSESEVTQSRLTLGDRMDCSLPGSSIRGIFQARVLEWVKTYYSSVQFSRWVVSHSLRPNKSQHMRTPCPLPTPGVHSDSCPSSQWCHPAISSSVIPFSTCPQSLPASESFPMSQHFTWGGQSTGVSALALFLPKRSQGWSPSEWTGWISLQSKGLSRVFSNTIVQKHRFFGAQPSSQSNSHIHTWPLEKP